MKQIENQLTNKKENLETEIKKSWEKALDFWVEEKIQKELNKIISKKYKGKDEKIINNMRENW